MKRFVVDTNVAIVASGREMTADLPCQLACVKILQSLVSDEVVVVDDKGLIFDEYKRRLSFSGRPGIGDVFFKYVFDHQYRGERVLRVTVTPSEDDRCGFEELPLNRLDRADRKFLAVALVGRAIVVNAKDSDWSEQQALLDDLGVEIVQLCPQYASKTVQRER